MQSGPEIPAVARLLEAATSLRQQAAALRAAHPDRRASSPAAQVDVGADGRLLGIRVLDEARLRALDVSAHVMDLARAGAGESVDGVVVEDLPPEAAPAAGLGPGRFTLPPGIDEDAPPEVVLSQVDQRLRARWAAAERAATRMVDADGMGAAPDAGASIRLGALGQLLEVRITNRLLQEPIDHINDVLRTTLDAARADLRDQIEQHLQEGE